MTIEGGAEKAASATRLRVHDTPPHTFAAVSGDRHAPGGEGIEGRCMLGGPRAARPRRSGPSPFLMSVRARPPRRVSTARAPTRPNLGRHPSGAPTGDSRFQVPDLDR